MRTRNPISYFLLIFSYTVFSQTIPHFQSKGIIQSTEIIYKKEFKQYDLFIDETDPMTKITLTVTAHYFQNSKTSKLPILIIVPPINGISIREKKVTNHFLAQGYHVLVIEPIKNITNVSVPISEFQNNLLSFVGAVRSVIDVVSKKPEIDTTNIFLWATSMGAIYSSIVIGVDNRINSGIFIVGGASIADIVTESDQKYIRNYKNQRIKEEKLKSDEEFRSLLKANITVDPLNYAKNKPPQNIYFVMATKDKTVPTKYQEMLYSSFGSPTNLKKVKKKHAGALMSSHLFHLSDYSRFTNSMIKK